MRWLAVLILFVLGACASPVDLPKGFRMNLYKAPVPDTVPGGTVLSTSGAVKLHREGRAVFVDVIGSGHYLTPGIEDDWLVVYPRNSIPGAYWLPDVGRGALTKKQDIYFHDSLLRLTHNDMAQPLVFFCLTDCWMSWNAAKRAALIGYSQVYWYPSGSDGWAQAGEPLKKIKPYCPNCAN